MTTDSKNLIEEIIENAVSKPLNPEDDSISTLESQKEKQTNKSVADLNGRLNNSKVQED